VDAGLLDLPIFEFIIWKTEKGCGLVLDRRGLQLCMTCTHPDQSLTLIDARQTHVTVVSDDALLIRTPKGYLVPVLVHVVAL
jgi:hypothetical protein